MSYIGKLTRGSKWFNLNRDANGDLFSHVKDDKDKMEDINFFLERTTKETRDSVTAKLLRLQALGKTPEGKRGQEYQNLLNELKSLSVPEVKESKSKGSK